MDKRLSEIKETISNSKLAFYDYLMQTEKPEVMDSIVRVSKKTRVFIFSGVIRNFFLGERNNRDIDIILENEIDLLEIFADAEIHKNSFGGYKIFYHKTTIDLWYLKQTWAFQNDHFPTFSFNLEAKIPDTAFFNFSSAVYSFNDKTFYYTDDFVRFLRDREIDFVYKKNPNPKLCVVNTLYYSDKYKLNIKDRLKKFIFELYNENDKDYQSVQLRHFGIVIYPNDVIEHRLETIFDYKKRGKGKTINRK
ncbi:hypothetical protein GWC95_00225 [Sediminibacterium roseum]|uniref:Poly A polymerase head domain-containing protein n=1 Tax=Sediminibacterium roseum TaxID=1978412 RepID=A0ABW9ZMM6_9BACT|nr:hypothetical protein [Sediminibacterium roseum]NCI48325.1 hypothetical protein [Sediminibacterium roseum]